MVSRIRSLGMILATSLVVAATCPGTGWGKPPGELSGQKILPKRHPDIQKIEEALEGVRKNRTAVLVVSRAVVSRTNRSLAASFPDVCKTPVSPGPIPISYPNIGMAKDRTGESKSDKLADQAVSILMGSKIKKTKGDEVGTAVKRLDAKVGKILAERALTRDEERLFRKEWMDLIEEARQLERALAKDVKDLEDILEAAKKELGIRIPVQG